MATAVLWANELNYIYKNPFNQMLFQTIISTTHHYEYNIKLQSRDNTVP